MFFLGQVSLGEARHRIKNCLNLTDRQIDEYRPFSLLQTPSTIHPHSL